MSAGFSGRLTESRFSGTFEEMPSLDISSDFVSNIMRKMVAAESLHLLRSERDMDVLACATSFFGAVEAKPKVSLPIRFLPGLTSKFWLRALDFDYVVFVNT